MQPECFWFVCSPVQLDDFETYIKDMSKDSAYKFSLQFEVRKHIPCVVFPDRDA